MAEIDEAALTVECEICDAAPGKDCVSPDSHPLARTMPHLERVVAAQLASLNPGAIRKQIIKTAFELAAAPWQLADEKTGLPTRTHNRTVAILRMLHAQPLRVGELVADRAFTERRKWIAYRNHTGTLHQLQYTGCDQISVRSQWVAAPTGPTFGAWNEWYPQLSSLIAAATLIDPEPDSDHR